MSDVSVGENFGLIVKGTILTVVDTKECGPEGCDKCHNVGVLRDGTKHGLLDQAFLIASSMSVKSVITHILKKFRFIDEKGEVAEWLKAPVLKTGGPMRFRGFKSHPLRQIKFLDSSIQKYLDYGLDSQVK